MHQNFQNQMNAGFQAFGQHIHTTMYEPVMTRLQNVGETLHSDIDALNDTFTDLTTSEQHQQLMNR